MIFSVLMELICFLAALAAIAGVVLGWKRSEVARFKLLVAGVAVWVAVHALSNIAELSNINIFFSVYENHIQVMGPVLWGFLFYGLILSVEVESREKSEQRLTQVVEAVNDAIWELRPDTGEVRLSPRWSDMLGYNRQELPEVFETWRQLIHPGDLAHVRQVIEKGIFSKDIFEFEFRIRAKNGEWLCISSRGRSVEWDETGRATRLLGVHTDITARKQAQKQLSDQKKRLDYILAGTNVGTWEWNVQTGETVFNKRWAEIIGYTLEEISPTTIETWMRFAHPEDLKQADRLLNDCFEKRSEFYDLECRMKHKSGGWVWVLDRGKVATWTEDGKPEWMYGTHQDVTERKRVEEQLREVQRMAGLGSWTWDVDTGDVSWSEEVYKIFGLEPRKFTPKIDSILSLSSPWPEDQARGLELVRRAMNSREQGHYDQRFLRPDGSTGYYHSTFQGEYDSDGRLVRIKGSVLDVTERNRALEQAEAANQAKSEFLANMSHEIRTPLNGLMGILQLMKITPLNNEQVGFIDNAMQAGKRLTGLLGDILDLSRIEAGKMTIVKEPFDFKDAMDAVVQLFEPIAAEKGLKLKVHIDPSIPGRVVGDTPRLQQVLTNLVGNAIKFTPEGSVDITAYYLKPVNGTEPRVLFSVSDTGIGIPDDMLGKLFKPFSQVEEKYTRKFQGAGLGLAISRRLVGLMGGTMAVESGEGLGAVFHFCLPLKPEEAFVPESPGEVAVVLDSLKILLAEDDEISAIATIRLLEGMGHKVICVIDGELVLEKLREDHFDLVLMDVQMPRLDGVEATSKIRGGAAGKGNAGIPIVAMTAYAMAGDKEQFLKSGMDGYLSKPLDMGELKAVLSSVLKDKAGTG